MYMWWAYFVWLIGYYLVGTYFSSCLIFRFSGVPKIIRPFVMVAIGSVTLYFKAKLIYDMNTVAYQIVNWGQTFLLVSYVMICFKDPVWKKILVYILSLVAASLGEVGVRIVSSITGIGLDLYFNDFTTIKYFAFAVFQQSFYLFIIAIVWKRVEGKSMNLSGEGFMLLFPISQVMIFYYCIKTVYSGNITENITGLVVLLISIIADILILNMLMNLNEKAGLERQLKEKEQLRALEALRYEELEARREELSKFRHDYNNQLTTALLLEEQGNGEVAKEMIGQLRKRVEI